MTRKVILVIFLALGVTTGCEQLGIPDPEKQAAAATEEGKAVGGACRHSGRALEDCYALNPGSPKAAVFDGWRSMNDYMTENRIEVVPPTLPPTTMGFAPKRAREAEPSHTAASDDSHAGPRAPETSARRSTLRTRRDAALNATH